MAKFILGATEKIPKDDSIPVELLPSNKILYAARLNNERKPDVTPARCSNLKEVFEKFRPAFSAELESTDGQQVNANFEVRAMKDFTSKELIEKNDYLSEDLLRQRDAGRSGETVEEKQRPEEDAGRQGKERSPLESGEILHRPAERNRKEVKIMGEEEKREMKPQEAEAMEAQREPRRPKRFPTTNLHRSLGDPSAISANWPPCCRRSRRPMAIWCAVWNGWIPKKDFQRKEFLTKKDFAKQRKLLAERLKIWVDFLSKAGSVSMMSARP